MFSHSQLKRAREHGPIVFTGASWLGRHAARLPGTPHMPAAYVFPS